MKWGQFSPIQKKNFEFSNFQIRAWAGHEHKGTNVQAVRQEWMSNPLYSSECWAFAQKAVQHMKKNKTNQLNQNKQFNKTILRLRNNTNLSIVPLRACDICIWFPWLSWPLTRGILLLRPLQHNHITTDVHCSFPNAYMINTGGQNMIFDLITSALICHLKNK